MSLSGSFSKLRRCKILLAGDLMVDTYTMGEVGRVSPEAPVCVLKVQKEESRPGGAGNAALNLQALGAEVVLMGRIGADDHGQNLLSMLDEGEVDTDGIVAQRRYATPVKQRLLASSQQLVRVDYEDVVPLHPSVEDELIAKVPSLIAGVDAVAISDYAKGFLSPKLLQALIKEANRRQLPVIVDPKGVDFSKYSGATIIKPNFKEALEASGLEQDVSLEEITAALFEQTRFQCLVMTRSRDGISVFTKEGERTDFPTQAQEVVDVTGAGDTVLAMLTYAIASGLNVSEATQFANVAAGIVVEHVGCARVDLAELASRFLKTDVQSKIFEHKHLYALKEVLKEQPCTILTLFDAQELSSLIFQSIKKIQEDDHQHHLLIYIADPSPSLEFLHILASIDEVDFIILKNGNLRHLFDEVSSDQMYLIENDECRQVEMSDLGLTI